MSELRQLPARLDVVRAPGDDVSIQVTVTDDGVAVDISGWTLSGEGAAVTITDGAAGKFTVVPSRATGMGPWRVTRTAPDVRTLLAGSDRVTEAADRTAGSITAELQLVDGDDITLEVTESGAVGPPGTGIAVKGSLNDVSELPAGAEEGDAYLIGGDLWVWDGTEWVNAGNIEGPAGPQGDAGDDGREVQLRVDGANVEWRYVGEVSWTLLVPLADITGADGVDGVDGTDGREVQLQADATHIQWRYVGELDWVNLVALADLTGADGADGIGVPDPAAEDDGRILVVDTGALVYADPASGGGLWETLSDITLAVNANIEFAEPSAGDWADVRAFRLTSPHIQANRTVAAINQVIIRINADTAANYTFISREMGINDVGGLALSDTRSASTSYITLGVLCNRLTNTNRVGTFDALISNLPDHWRSVQSQASAQYSNVDGRPYVSVASGVWRSTDLITAITVRPEAGTSLFAGSRVVLEGLRA